MFEKMMKSWSIVQHSASLLVATTFLVLFIRAVRSGQFDDTVTPAWRILSDDKDNHKEEKK